MKEVADFFRKAIWAFALVPITLSYAHSSTPEANSHQRTFHESPAVVKKALQQIQNSLAGHLPVLDGFVNAGDHSLDRYQRGYFQASVQVGANEQGETIVHVSAKITAWYADPVPARSGYQLLSSNGRIESDILDQLAEQLDAVALNPADGPGKSDGATTASHSLGAIISAPTPQLPESRSTFSSSSAQSLAAQEQAEAAVSAKKKAGPDQARLQAEVEQLEGILKNQAHPHNLVAVKKSGTAVVATPSLTAKPLFLASAHDEFEILNFDQDWVHVRISGLSRGWIWRNDLEMPGDIPDTQARPAPTAIVDLFHVVREETAPFPGDWEPLRGKTVKIISMQKTNETAKEIGPEMKLELAKAVFDKSYTESIQKPSNLAGIVLIFDSSDGGMIAASQSALEKWKAGKLSDAAFWHSCFFDPPETFLPANTPASQ